MVKLIQHSAPEMLVVDESHREVVERIRGDVPGVKHFVLLGEPQTDWTRYEQLLASASEAEPAVAAQPDDVLCLIYTSGTTGAPKGVAVTHAGALGNCRTAATEMLALTENDVTMAVMCSSMRAACGTNSSQLRDGLHDYPVRVRARSGSAGTGGSASPMHLCRR